ncbi:MAG: lysoplasmalogenase [Spirochaetes bacterium]|jgi:uncharacterized membrane protein YhhN|nr:lysoplasmalogenase [Spirochaetota bacterium]
MELYPVFISIYVLLVILVLTLENQKSRFYPFFKAIPALMCAFLLLWSLSTLNGKIQTHLYIIPVALVFGACGDFLLARMTDIRYGLIAFLAGHCIYSFIFISAATGLSLYSLSIAIPVLIYCLFFFRKLPSQNRSLRFPVLIYVTILTCMIITATNLSMVSGNYLFISGGLLFLCSDALLAWDMMVQRVRNSILLTLPLYYSAQLLLTSAIIETVIA